MLGLAAAARGAPFLARGMVTSRRKTSRVVIARTIIDGSTSDMRESPNWIVFSISKTATGLARKAAYRAFAEPIALLPHAATKRSFAAQVMFGSAFCQNFDNVAPWHIMDSWCGIGATRRRAGNAAEWNTKSP